MTVASSAVVKAKAFKIGYTPSGDASASFAVAQPFNFSIANAGDKSVTAGSSVTNSISSSLVTGASQAVSFSVSGLPAGATASFSAASCSPACSTVININTTTAAAAATYSVTVTATGGSVSRTTTFALTILLAASNPPANPTGNVYYVATNGSDSVSCASARNIGSPKRTVVTALTCLSAGDTLYIRGGTYTGINNDHNRIPSGTSWQNPVKIASYPGETARLTVAYSTEAVLNLTANRNFGGTLEYVIFENLTLDHKSGGIAGSAIGSYGPSRHLAFVNLDVNSTGYSCVLVTDAARYWRFTGGTYHNCGSYGFYVTGDDNVFENLTIRDTGENGTGNRYAIHNFNTYAPFPDRNTYRNLLVYNSGGILIYRGDGNVAYNNIVRGAVDDHGFTVGGGASNTKIYNNTVYGSAKFGIDTTNSTWTIVKNNIFFGNRLSPIYDGGVGSIISNNLTADPSFVNASGNDFRLQSGSAAIDRGTNLSGEGINSDYSRSTSRPQGSGFDIGAYEYMP
jgi:parallel beta-helix repeat protein